MRKLFGLQVDHRLNSLKRLSVLVVAAISGFYECETSALASFSWWILVTKRGLDLGWTFML